MSHVGNCRLVELKPVHLELLDHLIEHPEQTLAEIAAVFELTPLYVTMLVHNDLFQAHLAQRRQEVLSVSDAPLVAKLEALGHQCVEKLSEKVQDSEDPEFIKSTTDRVLQRLGYGATRSAVAINMAPGGGMQPAQTVETRAAIEAGIRARRLLAQARGEAVDAEFEEMPDAVEKS